MICRSCKFAADEMRLAVDEGAKPTELHEFYEIHEYCDYPGSCTCQHHPIGYCQIVEPVND